jgi:hypothetical protein
LGNVQGSITVEPGCAHDHACGESHDPIYADGAWYHGPYRRGCAAIKSGMPSVAIRFEATGDATLIAVAVA